MRGKWHGHANEGTATKNVGVRVCAVCVHHPSKQTMEQFK